MALHERHPVNRRKTKTPSNVGVMATAPALNALLTTIFMMLSGPCSILWGSAIRALSMQFSMDSPTRNFIKDCQVIFRCQ